MGCFLFSVKLATVSNTLSCWEHSTSRGSSSSMPTPLKMFLHRVCREARDEPINAVYGNRPAHDAPKSDLAQHGQLRYGTDHVKWNAHALGRDRIFGQIMLTPRPSLDAGRWTDTRKNEVSFPSTQNLFLSIGLAER